MTKNAKLLLAGVAAYFIINKLSRPSPSLGCIGCGLGAYYPLSVVAHRPPPVSAVLATPLVGGSCRNVR